MITLYGVYRSRATRPLWLLEEYGVPFTHVPVIQSYRIDQPKAPGAPLNTASAEFLAINPLGQIPVLVDGDLVLTESLAISNYLARSLGGPLGPQSNAETALMEQWALFAATAIETPALEIVNMISTGGNTPEAQAAVAINAEKLRRPLRRLEQHLEARDWLVGDRFTVADINTAEVVRYAQGHPTLVGEFAKVSAWMARAQGRPAFKAMMAKRLAEPA